MTGSPRTGLVIASESDIHAFAVRHAGSEMGYDIRIVDTAGYLTEFDLVATFEGGSQHAIMQFRSGEVIDTRQVSGVWWRRPAPPKSRESRQQHPGLASTIQAEASHALFGSLNATVGNSFNLASHSRRATLKPLQLAKAAKCGLRVPRTLITTDPKQACHFFDELGGRVVYKLFEGTDVGFFETRRLKLEDLPELWRLQTCPLIFQEFIDGDFDIRATVVGKKIFASRIDFDKKSDVIDTRFTMLSTKSQDIPSNIGNNLISIVEEFGLVYAAIDMRYSETGGFTFFELNPEGQYLWNEIEAGLPISSAIAQRLLNV